MYSLFTNNSPFRTLSVGSFEKVIHKKSVGKAANSKIWIFPLSPLIFYVLLSRKILRGASITVISLSSHSLSASLLTNIYLAEIITEMELLFSNTSVAINCCNFEQSMTKIPVIANKKRIIFAATFIPVKWKVTQAEKLSQYESLQALKVPVPE